MFEKEQNVKMLYNVLVQHCKIRNICLSLYRDGDFADFSAFADFFSVLPIFRISADFCSFKLSAL